MPFAARGAWITKRFFLFMVFALRACLPEAGAAEIIISTATTSTVTLGAADSLTVTSSGSITLNNGSNAVSVGTGVDRITNGGAIFGTNGSSSGYGIILQNDSTIANGINNTGNITGYASAIGVVNRSSSTNNVTINGGITNSGTLQINVPSNNVLPSTIMLAGATLHGGISNSGSILATGASDRYSTLWIESGAVINGGLLNSGTMSAQVNAGVSVHSDGTLNDGVTNTATGLIQSGGSAGLRVILGGTLNGGLNNAGTIRGTSGILLNSTSTLAGGVLNSAGGVIEASAAAGVGISVTGASTISGTVQNQGSIAGGTGATGDGVLVQSGATLGGLINSGAISSGRNALNLQNTANPFVVTNTGTMTGNVALGINALTLQGSTARVIGATTGSAAGIVNVNGTFASEGTFNVGTFNVGSGASLTTNHNITVGAGGLNNAGRMIVNSGSSVTVTATSGGQFLTSGNLLVNGSLAGEAVSVQSTGTLAGDGTVSAATTIAGLHSPGNSPGVQTFGSNLTYQAGASVLWELIGNTTGGSGNFDQIGLPTGNLTFSGSTALNLSFNAAGSSVNWSDSFWSVDRTWLLHDLSSGVTTGIGNFSVNTLDWADSTSTLLSTARSGASFSVGLTGQDVVINYVAPVPEPSTYAMAFAGLACGGYTMFRRRKRA
jgi:hypothetical protein